MSVRETIGYVVCPFSGERAEVRMNKKGKLYYVGSGGQITPNRPAGQAWLQNNMVPLEESERVAINSAPLEYGQRVIDPTEIKSVEVKKNDLEVKLEVKKESELWTII